MSVASKWGSSSMIGEGFDQAFDELFEEILITRWRGRERVRDLGNAVVAEEEERYRVKIALPGANPDKLQVEVSEWRLLLLEEGREDSALDFAQRLDTERVSARFEDGILEVILPKARGRRIEVR
jgi:HSP20 family molecular chaperone IbpA